MPEQFTAESTRQSAKLSATGTPTPTGSFEILAISAGDANGWTFTQEALKKSLPMWDNAHTFIDHEWFSHSIKDLAGICSSPRWDNQTQGVLLTLRPVGPAAAVLSELGRQLLSEGVGDPAPPTPVGRVSNPTPKVGFSADIVFTAKGKTIDTILKVNSVDLVIDPARGGMFKRVLNSLRKDNLMPEETLTNQSDVGRVSIPDAPTPDQDAARLLLGERQRQAQLAQEAEAAREVHLQQCDFLLESGLATSKLPAPVAERIRKQFSGRIFKPTELTAAIDDNRAMLSELSASETVKGPSISAMFNTADQLTAAVEDMFDVPRSAGLENVKPARLTGIRELYMALTGDYDLHGGFYGDRVQLATTSDFTGLVKNAMNKIVVNTWDQLGRAGYDWWNRVSTVEHFNTLNGVTGVLVGTVGSLPTVAEGAEYTELAVGDSPETASFTKYGGYIPLTLELIDRDEVRRLKAYPRELAAAGLRNISSLVAAIFTSNSAVGPTMADTGALFNNTAVTTKGGHANLLTVALSASQWDVVGTAMFKQAMLIKQDTGYYGTGPALGISPKYLMVPRKLQLTAMKIIYPTLENTAQIYSENQQRGQPGDVVVVPDWTDDTDWAAVADPRIVPSIFVGERFGIMPEIFIAGDNLSPAVFTNDESRLKVRHFLAVWVNDFRPLHKSNVAG